MNTITKLTLGTLLAVGVTMNAQALLITPADADFSGFNNGSLSTAAVQSIVGTTGLSSVYKQNAGGSEEGLFAGSYTTTFFNTIADPSDGDIQWNGAPNSFITGAKIYLYVKDGTPRPYYIFDISTWNGQETISLRDFYPAQGAISHATIYAGGTPSNGGPPPVADPVNTLFMLGTIVVGMCVARRWMCVPVGT